MTQTNALTFGIRSDGTAIGHGLENLEKAVVDGLIRYYVPETEYRNGYVIVEGYPDGKKWHLNRDNGDRAASSFGSAEEALGYMLDMTRSF